MDHCGHWCGNRVFVVGPWSGTERSGKVENGSVHSQNDPGRAWIHAKFLFLLALLTVEFREIVDIADNFFESMTNGQESRCHGSETSATPSGT